MQEHKAGGAHASIDDERNQNILIYINGDLVPRAEAKVSVYDSGFMLGDGVWEGLRLHKGKFSFIDDHLDRLFAGAKALDMDIGKSREELKEALQQTIDANGMTDGVHARLMVTRGPKKTPYQDPRLSLWGPTIVIIAEYKSQDLGPVERGINLFTVHVRRGHPDVQDPRLNSHSKINCITAMIQSYKAGADEALMLDPHGFVSTCNSTNFFIVRKGEVWTSTGDYAMKGITRQKTIDVCKANGIPVFEKNFSLVDVYSADEAFVTGTFGAQTPVVDVDGRTIGDGVPGPMVKKIRALYSAMAEAQ
ncbi:aminotransferase class IV [Alteromonas lipolytica]|uniref:Aminodeoxychorismate lyase n=1 Tax=Alteromonas lipolytica TaxID=1856405 RepID=A0A1E8FIR6_9ALTE|nr:aminotransferase class IV [Alteromonas lipolytica]OFI35794.1 aminotransferase class IV [Alteromonas lipolytica]GGF80868.1 aminotransferase class IV [Alteromonas lipolytica]